VAARPPLAPARAARALALALTRSFPAAAARAEYDVVVVGGGPGGYVAAIKASQLGLKVRPGAPRWRSGPARAAPRAGAARERARAVDALARARPQPRPRPLTRSPPARPPLPARRRRASSRAARWAARA